MLNPVHSSALMYLGGLQGACHKLLFCCGDCRFGKEKWHGYGAVIFHPIEQQNHGAEHKHSDVHDAPMEVSYGDRVYITLCEEWSTRRQYLGVRCCAACEHIRSCGGPDR